MLAVIRRAVLLAVLTSSVLAHADEPVPAEPSRALAASCADAELAPRLTTLLRARRFADVHHAAVGVRVVCGDVPLERARLLDAIALLRLEDRDPALADLQALAAQPTTGQPATLVLAWAYFANGDRAAGTQVLTRVPSPRAAAVRALASLDDRSAFERQLRDVPEPVQSSARLEGARYRAARGKHPALAGVLSAVLPGAGQVYAGSWQAAAVTLVLNGLFVTATVELALDKHYFTAAAAGTAASFFYVGGIMNAVDLARRRNERGGAPHAEALERLLLPELDGSFAAP
ncbi:MAG: hypothetical protein JWP01_3943 [Myxococcales bacterium]|nr:hypothetical protein [Myxococcales bacterium]